MDNSTGATGIPDNITDHSLTKAQLVFQTYHYVVIYVIISPIIVGNSLTLACICKFNSLRTNRHILIGSLSAADLLVGVLNVYVMIVEPYILQAQWGIPGESCAAKIAYDLAGAFFSRFPIYASVMMIIVIAFDRFVAVMFPLRYPLLLSRKKLVAVICIGWLSALLLSLAGFFSSMAEILRSCTIIEKSVDKNSAMIVIATYTSLATTLCFIYYNILRESKRQLRQIVSLSQNETSLDGNPNREENKLNTPFSGSKSTSLKKSQPNLRKAHGGILMILLMYLLFYIPYVTLCCLQLADNGYYTSNYGQYLRLISHEATLMNSSLNICMYTIFYQDFREAYKRILCCCCTRCDGPRTRIAPMAVHSLS